MKQYVLDEPGARPSEETLPAPSSARRRWRWPTLLAAVGAAALVAGYSLVEVRSKPAPRAVAIAVVPTYMAPPVVADPPPAITAPAPALPEPPESRVTRADGRYVIDLHAAAIGPALAMLSEATRTTVTGADLVATSPTRLTTSFVAASPLEAWKGVFGDVASFAMSCGHSSCAVRFVSLVGAGSGSLSSRSLSSTPSSPLQPTLMAPPGAPPSVESGEPAPEN